MSTKILSAAWWMVNLIMLATYTANLAAVLTVELQNIPFNSFSGLANQTEYNVGAVDGGSTVYFIKVNYCAQGKIKVPQSEVSYEAVAYVYGFL